MIIASSAAWYCYFLLLVSSTPIGFVMNCLHTIHWLLIALATLSYSSHRIWLGELGTRRPAKSKKEKELAKINDGEETGGLK
jgi:hypothetical protein